MRTGYIGVDIHGSEESGFYDAECTGAKYQVSSGREMKRQDRVKRT